MEQLPEGWTETTLGEVAQVVGGGTPRASDASNFQSSEGTPWLTPADLSGFRGKLISRGARNLSEIGLRNCSAKLLPAGTVLMSSRAPIGYLAIAANPIATNQGFKSFVCSEALTPDYLFHWLAYLRPQLEEMASGTTFLELSGARAKKIPVRFPPLAEQKRIVEKVEALLARVQAARDRLERMQQILEQFRQAVLAAACEGRLTQDWREAYSPRLQAIAESSPGEAVEMELPDLPAEWGVISLGAASTRIQYGTSDKASGPELSGGIPVLRMGNIQNGKLDLRELKFVRPSSAPEPLLLQKGDLLFNRTNSPELVGKSAVVTFDRTMTFASYLIRVQLDSNVLLPEFVNFWLGSPWGREWARQVRTDGVSQSNINSSKLASLPVPLPIIDEQVEIVRRTTQILSSIEAIENRTTKALATASCATSAILAKAFTGELELLEAELARAERRGYESGKDLLARIRANGRGAPAASRGTGKTHARAPASGRGTRR